MAVKIKKIIKFEEGPKEVNSYLPADSALTKGEKEKADQIYEIIKTEVNKINKEFQKIKVSLRKDGFSKWKWLSERLKKLIPLLKKNGMKGKDFEDNLIWVSIGQHLCKDLSKGMDTRRSGTHKDHYRKVYLLSEIEGINWINSWLGWDAFADRGDAILQNPKIFLELDKKFHNFTKELKTKDYQFIAKKLIEHMPMSGVDRKSISSITSKDLALIAEKVFEDYHQERQKR